MPKPMTIRRRLRRILMATNSKDIEVAEETESLMEIKKGLDEVRTDIGRGDGKSVVKLLIKFIKKISNCNKRIDKLASKSKERYDELDAKINALHKQLVEFEDYMFSTEDKTVEAEETDDVESKENLSDEEVQKLINEATIKEQERAKRLSAEVKAIISKDKVDTTKVTPKSEERKLVESETQKAPMHCRCWGCTFSTRTFPEDEFPLEKGKNARPYSSLRCYNPKSVLFRKEVDNFAGCGCYEPYGKVNYYDGRNWTSVDKRMEKVESESVVISIYGHDFKKGKTTEELFGAEKEN